MTDNRCPLLALPPELRNRIYDLVLLPHSINIDTLPRLKHATPPPIVQVNRQMRTEVLPMYYSQIVFDFGDIAIFRNGIDLIHGWFNSIGEDALANVTHVRVRRGWMTIFPVNKAGVIFTPQGNAEGRLVACEVPFDVVGLYVYRCQDQAVRVAKPGGAEEDARRMEGIITGEIGRLQKLSGGTLTAGDWKHLITVFGWIRDARDIHDAISAHRGVSKVPGEPDKALA